MAARIWTKIHSIIRRLIAGSLAFVLLFGAISPAAAERLPNDEYFDTQWYLSRIGAPAAWEHTLGFEGVTVAVIDSGVDLDHPDLQDNIWRNDGEVAGNGLDDDGNGYADDVHGWDFVDADAHPVPNLRAGDARLGVSHGTVSAGVIAARGDNGIGIAGVTWQTTIMPLRALDDAGEANPVWVVRAVEYAVHNGADIINLSLVGAVQDDLLRVALRRAHDAGVFIVAASGNAPTSGEPDLDRQMRFPVCLDFGSDENYVFGVAAVDDHDRRAVFSNYGRGCVDLSAPGTRFISTTPLDESAGFSQPYGGYYNGTSIAAALVSGAAALVKAADRRLSPQQIGELLTETAVDLDEINPDYAGQLGHGRLDVAAAVERLLQRGEETATATIATAELLPPGASHRLVATAPGPGPLTELRLFTLDGVFVRGWAAFGAGFRGGATVAAADFGGSGEDSIVAAAGAGGTPQVRIFNRNTEPLGSFMAYDQRFSGGVNLAAGDFDGDGRDELATAPASGGGPHVRVFTGRGAALGGFFAFDAARRGGWQVAAGDFDGDGRDELVVMDGATAAVKVMTVAGETLAHWRPALGFAALGAATSLALGDADRDGRLDVGVRFMAAAGQRLAYFQVDGEPIAAWSVDDAGQPGWPQPFGNLPGEPPVVRFGDIGFVAYPPRQTDFVRAALLR
jgi:hypothetical protein